jgi:uncharacterized protein
MRNILGAIWVGLLLIVSGDVAITGPLENGAVAYQRGDFASSLRELRPLAEQGNALAQSFLALMYYGGQGVAQDYRQAARWYRLAAEQGNAFDPRQYAPYRPIWQSNRL